LECDRACVSTGRSVRPVTIAERSGSMQTTSALCHSLLNQISSGSERRDHDNRTLAQMVVHARTEFALGSIKVRLLRQSDSETEAWFAKVCLCAIASNSRSRNILTVKTSMFPAIGSEQKRPSI
jgi:hypothetical protein